MFEKIYENINYNIDAYFELTIIFKYKNRYVYLQDDADRLKSIFKLPSSLKDEWIKRNVFDVDIKVLESLKKRDDNTILISLIRDFKLNELLNSFS